MESEEWGYLSFNFTAILNSQRQETSIANYLWSFWKSEEDITTPRRNTENYYSISQLDFSRYLGNVGYQLRVMRKNQKEWMRYETLPYLYTDMTDCFSQIPYVYMQKDYCLNFYTYGDKHRMLRYQLQLNDYLDMIYINLFNEITYKFSDFFKILKNLDFLDRAVEENLGRLKSMRQYVQKLSYDYYGKAKLIYKKVRVQQNKEKLLKYLIIVRSLKKLPPTINSILYSSLPYECVGLLSSGRQTYKHVAALECLRNVGRVLENGDNIVKHSLYKQFSDKIFLYLTAPITPPFINRLNELPSVGAVIQYRSGSLNDTIVEDTETIVMSPFDWHNIGQDPTEIAISRIIIESYLLVDYSSNSTLRVKLMEFVKISTKSFMDDLKTNLCRVIKQEKTGSLSFVEELSEYHRSYGNSYTLEELADQISPKYFSRALLVFHDMFRETIIRLVGCTSALLNGFYRVNNLNVEKASGLLYYFLSIAVSICKYITEKAISFLALKKLSHETLIYDFYNYVVQLGYWEEVSQQLATLNIFDKKYEAFSDKLIEYNVKLQAVFYTLKNTKMQLLYAYINNMYKNVESEIKKALEEDNWQTIEYLPPNFRSVFAFILYGEDTVKNKQKYDANSSLTASICIEPQNGTVKLKNRKTERVEFKLLKSVIIINKKQYKMTVALLLFVEILEYFLKIEHVLPETHDKIMTKISEIVRHYSFQSMELIVSAQALKYERVKTKNITVRQLCLSWSCLKLIHILISSFEHYEMKKAVDALKQHSYEIIKRLSSIITLKIDSEVSALSQLNFNKLECPTEKTLNIVGNYRQMVEILDEFMTYESVKQVMQAAVALIIKKYIGLLEEKGNRGKEYAIYFVREMKILERGFEKEYNFIKSAFSI